MLGWLRKKLNTEIQRVEKELSTLHQTIIQEEVVLRSTPGRYMGEHIDYNHSVLDHMSKKLSRLKLWRDFL